MDLSPEYLKPLHVRPPMRKGGDLVFAVPEAMVASDDERALCLKLVADRTLFGHCFRTLLPGYLERMPRNSGVMIRGFVPTNEVAVGTRYPGDIDLLVIPYEADQLVLSATLAIEAKAVRAKFRNQGKSPGSFGVSQARALVGCGFPHVAVAHLIVSDESPSEHWRNVSYTRILDEEGRCAPLRPMTADMMPSDLMRRALGRLQAAEPEGTIGLLAAYIGEHGTWLPEGRRCLRNPIRHAQLLDAIHTYYLRNYESFLDTPARSRVHPGG